jgi:hypothetical protein
MTNRNPAPTELKIDERGALHPSDRAAAMLGLEEGTLAQWRHQKIGPAYFKIGRRAFYADSDLKEWIAGQRIEPKQAQATQHAVE